MSQPEKYPIALEQLMFVRTSVLSVKGHQQPNGPLDFKPENKLNVLRDDGVPNRFVASMRTTMNLEMDAKFPYAVDVECIAVLTADGSLSETDVMRGVTINAHSVLYGAIRETVAWITGRQLYGPLLLGLSVLQQAPAHPEQSK